MHELKPADLIGISGGDTASNLERALLPPGMPALPPAPSQPLFDPTPTEPLSTALD